MRRTTYQSHQPLCPFRINQSELGHLVHRHGLLDLSNLPKHPIPSRRQSIRRAAVPVHRNVGETRLFALLRRSSPHNAVHEGGAQVILRSDDLVGCETEVFWDVEREVGVGAAEVVGSCVGRRRGGGGRWTRLPHTHFLPQNGKMCIVLIT